MMQELKGATVTGCAFDSYSLFSQVPFVYPAMCGKQLIVFNPTRE